MKYRRTLFDAAGMAVLLVLAAEAAAAQSGEETVQEPRALPEELAPWAKLLNQEQLALDTLRRFDVAQQALMDWDLELASDLYTAGDRDVAQTKFEDARHRADVVRRAYEEFLKWYPNNARAHTYYGELLYDRFGEQAGALQNWRLAVQLDSKLSLPLNDLAIHYCHAGDPERGLRYFEQALKLDPDNPDYLYNGAQFYLTLAPHVKRRNKWDDKRVYREAMKFSRRAAQLKSNDYELWEDYAVNFFAAENFGVEPNWKEAADAWKQARARADRPDRIFYTWLNEARTAVRGKDRKRAVACLEEALRLHPESRVARQLLEEIRREGG